MKYQNYEKKMKKLRKVRNGLFHMRFVFLGTALAAIATGSAIMACTGMVNETTQLNSTYQYGETFKPEGNAFLSDVVYEYRRKGSDEWSETPPSNAGEYEYRYYTKNTFGGNRYSNPVSFEIAKKPIEIKVDSDKVIYGNEPYIDRPILIGEDKIDSFTFAYDSFTGQTTKVKVENVVIKNKNQEDVTANYDISCPKTDILFEKRVLDVKFKGGKKIYDNTDIVNEEDGEYNPEKLAFNDRIVFGPSKSLNTVGKVANIRDVTIYNEQNVDVTHLYRVEKTAEDLVIEKRKITIHSKDITREYNGLPAEQAWEYDSESLHVAPGHRLEVQFNNPDSWRVGSWDSTFTYRVVDDKTGEPVNDGSLYDVKCIPGKINILKKPVYISTNSVTKYFDGMPIMDGEFVASGLAQGDTIIPRNGKQDIPSFSWVGSTRNYIDYKIMRDGEEVTQYYEPTTNYGNLVIEKRPIAVRVDFKENKVYDGKPWTLADTYYEILSNDQDPTSQGLAPGHVEVPSFNYRNDIIDAMPHTIDDFSIKIYEADQNGQPIIDSDHDVTGSYQISYPGAVKQITIEKRPISIKTPDIKKFYDGKVAFDGNVEVTSGSLVPGHHFECISSNNQTDATTGMPTPNLLEIIIVDENGKNVTSNYDIQNKEWGNIEIDQVPIEVSVNDAIKDYDDKPYNSTNAELHVKYLKPQFNKLKVKAYGHVISSQIDVTKEDAPGELKIDTRYPIIVRQDEYPYADVTNNFDISISEKPGELTVDPLPISLKVKGRDVVFDNNVDETLSVKDVELNGAIPGHYLSNVTFTGDITQPGLEKTEISVDTFNIHSPYRNVDVTDNYYVSENISGEMNTYYGQKITIKSPDIIRKYSGEKLVATEQEKTILDVKLPNPNHQIRVTKWYVDESNYVDVEDTGYYDTYNKEVYYGQARNDFEYEIIDVRQPDHPEVVGQNVYRNISKETGEIRIEPREVRYRARGITKVYDGQEHSIELEPYSDLRGYEIVRNARNRVYLTNKNALLPGHKLFMTGFNATAVNAGTYDPFASATFTVYNGDEVVKESNYKIVRDMRSTGLTIEQRQITISTFSFSGSLDEYLNNPIYNNPIYNEQDLLPGDHIVGDLRDYTKLMPGESVYETNMPGQGEFRIVNSQGEDVTLNYNIITNYGYVSISSY